MKLVVHIQVDIQVGLNNCSDGSVTQMANLKGSRVCVCVCVCVCVYYILWDKKLCTIRNQRKHRDLAKITKTKFKGTKSPAPKVLSRQFSSADLHHVYTGQNLLTLWHNTIAMSCHPMSCACIRINLVRH